MASKGKEDVMNQLVNMNVLTKKEEYLKTGILPLDMYISGRNEISDEIGFIKGKFVSITGPNGIGKSTLAMELSKRFCKMGNRVVFCDYENGLNEKSLNDFGLTEFAAYNRDNPKKAITEFIDGEKPFLAINPETFNKTAVIWRQLIEDLKVKIDVGIFDSLKTIKSTYLEENVDSIEQLPMGINARSQEGFLPYMKNLFARNSILGLFINQYRTQMTQYGGHLGEPTNQAFLYNMDERLIMKAKKDGEIEIKVINEENEKVDKKIGNWVLLTLTKSRFGNSFSTLSLPIIFGKGVSIIYKYTNILLNNELFTPGPTINSVTDMKGLKEELSKSGDVSKFPDTVSKGMDGVYGAIKDNIELIEKYILDNNLIFVEKVV